jgi:hypothetical protein
VIDITAAQNPIVHPSRHRAREHFDRSTNWRLAMIKLSIRELSLGELDAVSGAGPAAVGPNEQILAHFLSIHERTTVGTSRDHFRPRNKK